MDKYEYKLRSDEIVRLIDEEKYVEAVNIADTIDWRRVKSVSMLIRVAALYRINRRNEDSRAVLMLAYDRYPTNRSVVYSLCEVSIELDDVVAAIEYYKEFVKLAPRDNGVFTLRYRILEAQEASLEERIEILEELKKRDYQEEWAYELAYLYHRVGLATKCIEECDDIILWFGDGPYVMKAMELKMLHSPLTVIQEKKYENMQGEILGIPEDEEYITGYESDTDVSFENTENNYEYQQTEDTVEENEYSEDYTGEDYVGATYTEEEPVQETSNSVYQNRYMDMSQYNTINLQKVVAESMRELFPDDEDMYAENREDIAAIEKEMERASGRMAQLVTGVSEVAPKPGTGAISKVILPGDEAHAFQQDIGIEDIRNTSEEEINEEQSVYESGEENVYAEPQPFVAADPKPVEDEEVPFRPMTGQMNIDEVLVEWERMKKENEEKRKEGIRQHVLQQTGQIFKHFDESISTGILGEVAKQEKAIRELMPVRTETFLEYDTAKMQDIDELVELDSIMEDEDSLEELANLDNAVPSPVAVAAMSSKPYIVINPPEDKEEFLAADESEDEIQDIDIEEIQDFESEELTEIEDIEIEEETEDVEDELELEMEDIEEELSTEDITDVEEIDEASELELESEAEIEERREDDNTTVYETESGELYMDENTDEKLETDEIEEILETEVETEDIIESEESEYEQYQTEDDILEQDEELEDEVNDEYTEESLTETEEDEIADSEEASKAEELSEEESDAEEEGLLKTREISMNTEEISNLPEKIIEATKKETKSANKEDIREFTEEENELFEDFAVTKKIKKQIVHAVDNMTLSSYTGNVLITGDSGLGTLKIAKNLIRSFQIKDTNFSGKIAKITGEQLNLRELFDTFGKLRDGALIVEEANGLSEKTLYNMAKMLNQDDFGLIVILIDTKKGISRMLSKQAMIADYFNLRIDLVEMDNNALVAYAKSYAQALEYSIDELGTLALYTRIANIQTGNHVVTKDEVRDIIDEAIWKSKKFKLKNFVDVLLAKRYDQEDMIVLKERDFM